VLILGTVVSPSHPKYPLFLESLACIQVVVPLKDYPPPPIPLREARGTNRPPLFILPCARRHSSCPRLLDVLALLFFSSTACFYPMNGQVLCADALSDGFLKLFLSARRFPFYLGLSALGGYSLSLSRSSIQVLTAPILHKPIASPFFPALFVRPVFFFFYLVVGLADCTKFFYTDVPSGLRLLAFSAFSVKTVSRSPTRKDKDVASYYVPRPPFGLF